MAILDEQSSDFIEIDNLSIRAILGIFPWERDRRQEVLISMRLHTDISDAAASDSIEDALDYKTLTKELIQFVQDSSFFLIEKLIEAIAARMLEDLRVSKVIVRVEKPGALRYAKSVAVQICRVRS